MDERKLREALKACLSGCEFPEERQQAVLRAIRKEEEPVKRKISMTLVFAIIMTLAIGGTAFAASLGVFGQSANDEMNEQSASRLERLETAAQTYNETQAIQIPDAAATGEPQTVYDEMLANLYGRRFNLTLNQAYFDGHKLYYAYTLTTDRPLATYSGEGAPTGFDSWEIEEEGKYVGNFSNYYEEIDRGNISFFAAHPVGYIARETMNIGDGASLNGKPLKILDSGSIRADDHTIQGFQEVELPEGFTPTDSIEVALHVMFGTSVYYQDETKIHLTHVSLPDRQDVVVVPFTVTLNGQTETYTGSVKTADYSAEATVRVSDVDISGEVVFDAPEWAAAFEAETEAQLAGKTKAMNTANIIDYVLIADGVELENRDGGFGVNKEGKYFIGIRYDLPESAHSLMLVPTSSGLKDPKGAYENENIILIR